MMAMAAQQGADVCSVVAYLEPGPTLTMRLPQLTAPMTTTKQTAMRRRLVRREGASWPFGAMTACVPL